MKKRAIERTAAVPGFWCSRSWVTMKYVSTFVLFWGPPLVSRSICPKVWKAKIDPTSGRRVEP